MRFTRFLPLAALVLAAPAAPAAAQSLWLVPEGRRTLLVEILRPTFANADAGFLTTAWFLGGRFAVTERVTLQVELPVAHLTLDDAFGTGTSETVVGNPYIGGIFRGPASAAWAEVGLRVPVGGENEASVVGLFSDIDRFDAWVDEVLPLKAFGGYRWSSPSGGFAQLRGGPVIWLDIGDADTEGVLHLNFLAGLEQSRFALAAGVAGWALLTEDGTFDERTLFLGGVLGEARLGDFRPGVTLFFPIDGDYQEVVDLVLGVRLGVVLP